MSVDDKWIVFQICYDLNTYFKKLIVDKYLLKAFDDKRLE